MVPTTRDKLSLFLIFVSRLSDHSLHFQTTLDLGADRRGQAGTAMFLPLTWYMVFSGDVSAMGWFAVHPPMQSLAITAFLIGKHLCFPILRPNAPISLLIPSYCESWG